MSTKSLTVRDWALGVVAGQRHVPRRVPQGQQGEERLHHDLAELHAHEPGGAEAHAAVPGTLPRAPSREGRPDEGAPGRGVELRGREQPPALGGERPPAPLTGPSLGAVRAVALPDEGGGAATGAARRSGVRVGRGELARHRRLRGTNELPLLPEGEPLHLLEHHFEHPVSVP